MDANPALASILEHLRDCNRSYVRNLHRIQKSAREAADLATASPHMVALGPNLVMDTVRLGGQRTSLVDIAYNAGASEEQIKITLGGGVREFYALHDILVGDDEPQSQA